MTASDMARVPTQAPPNEISAVRAPPVTALLTAASIREAASSRPKLYRSMRAVERICAQGFATPLPAMSGAVPPAGSYRPKGRPREFRPAPREAEESIPSEAQEDRKSN